MMVKSGPIVEERPDIGRYTGVYVSMDELVSLRNAELELDLQGHSKAMAAMAGNHRSAFRGRGIDFDEVRIYQPGDDVRNIDWRVTARTGRAHTKLFREERERPVYVVVDQRQAMFFGTRIAFKSVVAARLGALIAWATRRHGDRIGGFLFNDERVQEIRPREGKRGIQNFFRQLVTFNQQLENTSNPFATTDTAITTQAFNQSLQGLIQVVKPGSLVILISDFLEYNQHTQQQISMLKRHNDVIAIQVTDPIETRLPAQGVYGFTNGSDKIRIDTASSQLQTEFSERFTQQQQQLQTLMNQSAVPLIDISTRDNVIDRLNATLGKASRQGRRT